jgi:glycosyltransferase domain-containing protein
MLSDSRFTLVIPTYNRPWLLAGLLGYFASKQARFRILVIDSSTDKVKVQNQQMIARQPLNAEWYPVNQSNMYLEKVNMGLSRATTDYAALCADDDILFVEAIEGGIGEMERHADTVACHGLYLNFMPDGRALNLTVEYSAPSIDADSAIERVFQLVSRYEALNYAVYRRDCLTETLAASTSLHTPMYWELFASVAPLASGKVKRLPCVSNARRARVAPIQDRSHPIAWVCEDPVDFVAKFADYRERALAFFAAKGVAISAEIATKFAQAHVAYFIDHVRDPRGTIDAIGRRLSVGRLPEATPAAKSNGQGFLHDALAHMRKLKRMLEGPEFIELPIEDGDTVMRLHRLEQARIPRSAMADLSRYWAAVLQMDPMGSA